MLYDIVNRLDWGIKVEVKIVEILLCLVVVLKVNCDEKVVVI